MTTSRTEALVRSHAAGDFAAVSAAWLEDWTNGRPEMIAEADENGMGTIRTEDGYVGYVSTQRLDHKPLQDFRSIAKNRNPTWRLVFAKDEAGHVFLVGKLRKDTKWARERGYAKRRGRASYAEHLKTMGQPHPDQAEIDRESAALLRQEG